MNTLRFPAHLLLAMACLGMPLAAAAQPDSPVRVLFVNQGSYIDAGDGPAEVRENLQALEQALQKLGEAALAPGQQLRIEVTQVDLAGRIPYAIGQANPLRVLNGAADWPRIELHYSVTAADGQIVRVGEASIDDKVYLQHPIAQVGIERLRYERRMLGDWFERQFGPVQRTANRR